MILGADISAQGQHLLLAAAYDARQLPPPLAQHRKDLVRHLEVARDLGAGEFEIAHLDLGQIARQALRLIREPDIGHSAWQRSAISALESGAPCRALTV